MGTSNGTNVSYVCSTPAELTLDKGQIQLQVGTGYTAKKFNISATGGTQEWEIRPGSDGKFAAGVTFISLGLTSAILGFALSGLNGGFVALGVVGTAATVISIPITVSSFGKATLVRRY